MFRTFYQTMKIFPKIKKKCQLKQNSPEISAFDKKIRIRHYLSILDELEQSKGISKQQSIMQIFIGSYPTELFFRLFILLNGTLMKFNFERKCENLKYYDGIKRQRLSMSWLSVHQITVCPMFLTSSVISGLEKIQK